MALFSYNLEQQLKHHAPLAARMRPRSFDEFVGQEHLAGAGRAFRRAVESGMPPSMVLWGPPGTGKTTLALIIASTARAYFSSLSAVSSGVADLRKVIKEARDRLGQNGQRTILFIDEIHRFNKAQQDVVLPYVEDGTITLIGATTENPSFEVVSPLLSRSRVYTLHQLAGEEIGLIIDRALEDEERGLGRLRIGLMAAAREFLVKFSNGDARNALNALELAAASVDTDQGGVRTIETKDVEDAVQQRAILYDKAGDQHYDTISAYIKCLRGSDPDGALYWLARMLEAGEDPLFIVRRMVILAAEDIGMADPQALGVAVAAQQAVYFVGLPEGAIPMAQATVYLATAPKSNSSWAAYGRALNDVRNTRTDPVPLHLRNAVTGLMRDMGYGAGYKYAHDYPEHYAPQQGLPDSVKDHKYYEPTSQGYETLVKEMLEKLKEVRDGNK
ncbi:MAG: replication-associated recombination protein A [Dehalococcoidia bacterium]|nr:replication-associated recombination protein A [Dehalococcoidia bacterium]